MKKIRELYLSFFCILYEWAIKVKPPIITEWRVLLAICMQNIYMLFACLFIGSYVFGVTNFFDFALSYSAVIPASALVIINYVIFIHQEKWKIYLIEFNTWQPEKKRRYKNYTRLIILLTIGLMVISVYLMSINAKKTLPIV